MFNKLIVFTALSLCVSTGYTGGFNLGSAVQAYSINANSSPRTTSNENRVEKLSSQMDKGDTLFMWERPRAKLVSKAFLEQLAESGLQIEDTAQLTKPVSFTGKSDKAIVVWDFGRFI